MYAQAGECGVSDTQFPAAGVKCADCGCCQANVFADGVPICWDCDAGKPCGGKDPTPETSAGKVNVLAEKVVKFAGRQGNRAAKVLRKRGPKVKPEQLPDLRSRYDKDEEVQMEAGAQQTVPQEGPREPNTEEDAPKRYEVRVRMTAAAIERVWSSMAVEEKAEVISMALERRV